MAGLDWLRKAHTCSGKAEAPLLRHPEKEHDVPAYLYLPLQRLFPSFIRLGSRTVISSSFSPFEWARLEMGMEIAK